MNEPFIAVTGNLSRDPEVKVLPNNRAVCSFTLASTPRVKNGDAWEDGETLWLRCTAWGKDAETIAETFHKGDRVVVTGTLKQRTYKGKDGEQKTALEVTVSGFGLTPKLGKSEKQDDSWPF